ncbi:MAG: hypothetical protein ACK5MQ_17270, partial [Pikeienuella sp.]
QGLTQSLLEFAIGDQETILPLDAETGKQLFVWSCWPEKSEALERFQSRRPGYLSDTWVCDTSNPRIKTGRSAVTWRLYGVPDSAKWGY